MAGRGIKLTDGGSLTFEEPNADGTHNVTFVIDVDGLTADRTITLPDSDIVLGAGVIPGPAGATGPSPEHEWSSTSLRFQNPDGSWGTLVDLKGDTGNTGAQGVQGPTGSIGPQGPQGVQGERGFTGLQGIQGLYVTDAEVVSDDLIITLSDASTINAGEVVGPVGPTGSTGATGAAGADGANGKNAGLNYRYDSTTTMGTDPGTGDFRFNNATIASVTAATFSDTDSDSANNEAYILTWDDSTNTIRGTLIVRTTANNTNFAIFNITGSITNASGYTQMTLAYVASGGTFTNNDPCNIVFNRAGDVGATGPGSGDVEGPASVSADNPAVFDGATGKLIKEVTYSTFKSSLSLTKTDVGLANVDNTADTAKPVSTAQQTALDLKADLSLVSNVDNTSDATKNAAVATLTNKTLTAPLLTAAPSAADNSLLIPSTSWVNTAIATTPGIPSDSDKGDITVSGTGTVWTIDSGVVSNAKAATMATSTIKGRLTAGTGAPEDLSAANVKTILALTKSDVGLSNVDNTSDAAKPVSTATQTALDLKANLALAAYDAVTLTPSADQNDYALGISTVSPTSTVIISPTVSIKITGISSSGLFAGKRLRIKNGTDPTSASSYFIILELYSTASSSANRIYSTINRIIWAEIPTGAQIPWIIMPGKFVDLEWDGTFWRIDRKSNGWIEPYDTLVSGESTSLGSTSTTGTGAGISSLWGFTDNNTNWISGLRYTTGTTATGRAGHFLGNGGYSGNGSIVSIFAPAIDVLSDGTNTFTVNCGILDTNTTIVPDYGVGWRYNTVDSTDWEYFSNNAGVETKTTVAALPVTALKLVWLGVFLNGNSTRADYFYSSDYGATWTIVGSLSTNIPAAVTYLYPVEVILKSAGLTARILWNGFMGQILSN